MTRVVSPEFEPAAQAFEAWLETDPSYAAQLAVYHRGRAVLDLTVGTTLRPDTLLPVFSSSKGIIGIVVALLVERGQLDLDAAVSSYWPEFAQQGKGTVTVRQLLSHQAGLPGVDGGYTRDELLEHEPLARKLAAQRPYWEPGTGFAYHAVTIGTLADELVRRASGKTLAQTFHDEVARLCAPDVLLGVPAEADHRLVAVEPPRESDLAAWLAEHPPAPVEGVTWSTLPRDLDGLGSFVEDVELRRSGIPAAGAWASARGLARLYAGLSHDVDAPRLLTADTIARAAQVAVDGVERDTGLPARFGVVFQLADERRWPFGGASAFGHDGAGGSLAFNDPEHELAVGYVPGRVHVPPPGGAPDPRFQLLAVLRACALASI